MKVFGFIFAIGTTLISIGMAISAFQHTFLTGVVTSFLLGCVSFMVWIFLIKVVLDFEKTEKMKKLGKYHCGACWHDSAIEAIRCGNHN